jgi:hypothetical protein
MTEDQFKSATKSDMLIENCMLRIQIFDEVCGLTGWVPLLDGACDPLGINSLAPFFYDVYSDSLK